MLARFKAAYQALTTRGASRALTTRNAGMWDAGAGGSRVVNWKAQPAGINAWTDNPVIVRARAEGEFRNNAWARKIVDAWLCSVIGASGLNPQFKDKATAAAWARWGDSCDVAGRLDWCGMLHVALQTVIVSGECFVRFIIDGDGVPLRLQILGPEYLDTARIDRDTFAGIRFDGVKVAGFWLFERHPSMVLSPLRSVFVPAAECLHIFRPMSPGAERGVSWLAAVLLPLRELQEYSEAALTKQKIASLFSGFIRTPDGSNPLLGSNNVPSLEPGSMVRLAPNEEVNFSDPPDVGADFDPFIRAQLRKIASGCNIPYEILSGDASQITFASGRHSLLEWARHVEMVQHVVMVQQLCAPVLARWNAIAEALGVIGQPEKPRWIGPKLAMLDSRMEIAATVARIRAGLISRSEAVSAEGWNAADIENETAQDNERADRLGLVFDSDPRKLTIQGIEQQGAANVTQGAN